jgi:geranylgeranyl pyrophosphate synthase
MRDPKAEYDRCRALVDATLMGYFAEDCPQKKLLEAMRYSLLAGGKAHRPVLTLKFCERSAVAWSRRLTMPVQ